MKVFVVGGTGAIGGHAVPALIGAGHEVSALARTPHKAALLRTQGAAPTPVEAEQPVASDVPPLRRGGRRKAAVAPVG